VAPNLLRKPEEVKGKEIVFSDILEVLLELIQKKVLLKLGN